MSNIYFTFASLDFTFNRPIEVRERTKFICLVAELVRGVGLFFQYGVIEGIGP